MGIFAPVALEQICLKFVMYQEKEMNPYLILGVSEKADTETIKKAYRRLVKECHPDTHPGDREAEERFKRISEAYAVLSDEEKRKRYDGERAADTGRHKGGTEASQRSRQPFEQRNFKSGFADFFSFMESDINTKSGQKTQKKETKGNPIDTSALFERYMGFK